MTRSVLINRIGELVTNAPGAADAAGGAGAGPGRFAVINDAAVVIEGDRIAWTGPSSQAPAADESVDAAGRAVLPGFVDSHAHLVFAGERSAEFAARMAGRGYAAGGIRSTVAATRAATDADLRAGLRRLAGEMLAQGTTTFECKSGYGLTVEDEARSVALAAEATDEVTYLGAHVVPAEFEGDAGAYVDLVCGPMLDACAPHARWVDVFCERGAFSVDEARAVLTAGRARGLIPRIHASQLGPGQGVLLAVELGAASADHCTFLTDADVDALAAVAPAPDSARLSRGGHRRHPAAGGGIRHPPALPRRPPPARRGRDGRPGDRLQPGLVLHLEHAVLHRAGRPRHAYDHIGGGLGGHRGRRPRAPPDRRRLPGAGRESRPGHARRPVPHLSRLPARRPARPRRLAVRHASAALT